MYNFSTFSYKLFLHKRSYAVGNILLQVVIEQTVVVTMIALRTEQGCSIITDANSGKNFIRFIVLIIL